MAEHTPGPWYYSSGAVWADPNEHVAIAHADRNEPTTAPTERDANARLIAAAPELLEAASMILTALRAFRDQRPNEYDALVRPDSDGLAVPYLNAWDALKAAILKAEGAR